MPPQVGQHGDLCVVTCGGGGRHGSGSEPVHVLAWNARLDEAEERKGLYLFGLWIVQADGSLAVIYVVSSPSTDDVRLVAREELESINDAGGLEDEDAFCKAFGISTRGKLKAAGEGGYGKALETMRAYCSLLLVGEDEELGAREQLMLRLPSLEHDQAQRELAAAGGHMEPVAAAADEDAGAGGS